jgi:hypothetical protein
MATAASLEVGLAVRDITPQVPIRLAGYAGRNRPADKVDHPLLVQALALRNPSGERLVIVALDNCEVSHAFMEPVLRELSARFGLGRGAVAVVPSHTHSAPVLEQTLTDMAQPSATDRERIAQYSRLLKAKLVEVVDAADVRVGELLRLAGLPLQGLQRIWVSPEFAGEDLDGDVRVPVLGLLAAPVEGPVHVSHAPCADHLLQHEATAEDAAAGKRGVALVLGRP